MSSAETGFKILVGVDGSDSSLAALQWATALAAQREGSVTAAMTWSYPTALMMPVVGAPVVPADYVSGATRAKLGVAVAGTPRADLITEEWVIMGAPRSVLSDATEDHDLLVLGRTGNSRLRQLFVGSTAAYCVRHAECPVVVVRDAVTPEDKITVAVDGSPSSIDALVWALSLGDSQVAAVYSHDEWELDDLPLDDQFRADLGARAEEMLVNTIATAVERAGVDEERVVYQIMQGDPRTTLVDQAEPNGLLVLGAQGHSGISRWVLGSLADYAVQHAPGSVAIWR
jgi:nucleotide-binding universal stress UspA family protein